MAFQSVNQGTTKDPVKLTELKVGGVVQGYPISFRESQKYPGTFSILMQDEAGDRFYVNTAGNVKYDVKDGRIKLGLLTQITRREDRIMKNKKPTSHFEVLQDPERTIAVAAAPAAAHNEDDSFARITSSIGQPKEVINGAAERESVKAQAAKMTKQMLEQAAGKRSNG